MYNPTRLLPILFLILGCDHGYVPPEDPARGAISGTVTYEGAWPASESLFDVRFVAMRVVPEGPQTIIDEFEKQRIVLSQGLRRPTTADSFFIASVITGPYVYSGIAIQQSSNVFDWLPVGLYADNAGIIQVTPNDTAFIHVHVDFNNPPPFPPVANP